MSDVATSTSTVTERINRLADNLDPIPGQPSADDIFILRSKLINELYPQKFDAEHGKHNLMGIVTTSAKYKAKFGAEFPTYKPQPAVGKDMDHAEAPKRHVATVLHKARVADYEMYKAAINAVRSLLLNHVDETWIIALKKEGTEYGEVTPNEILDHLEKNCTGRHAVDSLDLINDMMTLHTTMDNFTIATYSAGLEERQRALKRIDPSTAPSDAMLLLYATSAMILTEDLKDRYSLTNKEWESLAKTDKTWAKWKEEYLLADTNLNIGVGGATGSANHVSRLGGRASSASASRSRGGTSTGGSVPTWDDVNSGFDNLANAVHTDKAVLEEQVATNAKLTTTNATLTATNASLVKQIQDKDAEIKKLKEEIAKLKANRGGGDKKLCPHCKKTVAHKADDCFELEKNASKRPVGWKPLAER